MVFSLNDVGFWLKIPSDQKLKLSIASIAFA